MQVCLKIIADKLVFAELSNELVLCDDVVSGGSEQRGLSLCPSTSQEIVQRMWRFIVLGFGAEELMRKGCLVCLAACDVVLTADCWLAKVSLQ